MDLSVAVCFYAVSPKKQKSIFRITRKSQKRYVIYSAAPLFFSKAIQ